MDVKTMNEQERRAYYVSEIARAKAAGLPEIQGSGKTFEKDGVRQAPGHGMRRDAETAIHIHQNAEASVLRDALTIDEKIAATSAGRTAAYKEAYAKGARPDENVVHRAGVLAVQAAAVAKVAAAKAAAT